jgi:hypothetical protein
MSVNSARSDGDELSLLRLAVEFRRDEYKELSENWRNLDTKAQGNIAISGILLAASVAFLSKGPSPDVTLQRWLILLIVVSLALTIILAVFALRVRVVSGPPHFGSMQEMIGDFLAAVKTEERAARMGDFLGEELSLWAQCNDETREIVNRKANLLSYAQLAIVFATLLVSIFTVLRIF